MYQIDGNNGSVQETITESRQQLQTNSTALSVPTKLYHGDILYICYIVFNSVKSNQYNKSNHVYYLNLVTRHAIYKQKLYIIICLPGRHIHCIVDLQHFFYPLAFLTIICMS